MAKTKTKPRSPANGVQHTIPGTTDPPIKAIVAAAQRYAKERDLRCLASKAEKAAHEFLLKTMQDNGLKSYKYGDLSVFVDETTKCKVKIGGDVSENGDGEE